MKILTLSDADLSVIAEALGALPYSRVAALFEAIQKQLNAQVDGAQGALDALTK